MGKLKTFINTVVIKTKKHSPEILIATAGICAVGGAVLACRATTKAEAILKEHKETLEKVKEAHESENVTEEEYTEDDYKKDITLVYTQTVIKLAKVYAPAIITELAALFCMFSAVGILKRRNSALTVACATLADAFASYRQRVRDRYGEETEFDIYTGVEEVEIEETVTDKNGNEKTKTKKVKLAGGMTSPFCMVFDRTNPNWVEDREMALCFLKAQERYFNDMLVAHGILPLNEIRKGLGFPPTQEGQVFGHAYMKNNPVGDNYVDIGINEDSKNFQDWFKGKNDFLYLSVNCDGNILEYFPSCKRVR